MEGTKHGPLVATQLLDVAIRVQAIRKYAVQQCALLLENSYLLTGQPRATMSEVLYAAAWICGEFSRYWEYFGKNERHYSDIINNLFKLTVNWKILWRRCSLCCDRKLLVCQGIYKQFTFTIY